MNLHELKPRLLAVAVFAVLSSSAFASVDSAGTPDATIPELKTYGVDVPTRPGLKTIVPQGWTLLIHKSAKLPPVVSWKPGDPWTGVIEDLANKNNLAVRMDWSTKTVTVMSPEVAAQQKAKEVEILQAAKTPLPSLLPTTQATSDVPVRVSLPSTTSSQEAAPTAPSPVAIATVPPQAQPVAQPSTRPALVDQLATLKQMSARAAASTAQAQIQPQLVANPQPVQVQIAPAVAVNTPVPVALQAQAVMPRNVAASQVGGSMKDLLAKEVTRFGYVLSWEAADVQIPGAVTLLGVDIGEDANLLQRAVGLNTTPVAIEVFRNSSVVRVVPRSRRADAVAIIDSPFNGTISQYARSSAAYGASTYPLNTTPLPVAQAEPTAPRSAGSPLLNVATVNVGTVDVPKALPVAQTSAPSQEGPASVKLTVLKGDSLSNSLKTFFLAQGWDLQWKATTDLQADYPVSIEGPNGMEVLKKLLPRLGLIADFYTQSKTVVIRNNDSSTN